MINQKRKTLCFVLTNPWMINAFLLEHFQALANHYEITVCVNTDTMLVSEKLDQRVKIKHIPIARKINPIRDIQALFLLTIFIYKHRFNSVHSLTPKGGLLGMLSAWICRVPVRIHMFTGQVWATHQGFSRALLANLDRLLAHCATHLLADSASQITFLETEGICRPDKVQVFGSGSISGVDLARFSSQPHRRESVRSSLGIPADAPLFLFLGRLQQDKGVLILANAFKALVATHETPHLLIAGPDEEHLSQMIRAIAPNNCHIMGMTTSPEDYLDASDCLVLPSFREGFGTVVIEAAAIGRPTIASRIYGLTDAVVDENTGILFESGNVTQLIKCLERMLNRNLREKLGKNAHARAQTEFCSKRITQLWMNFYQKTLGK